MTSRTPVRTPRSAAKTAPGAASTASQKVAARKTAAPKAPVKKAGPKNVAPESKETTAITPPAPPVRHKPKLVRDSFTIPKSEYALLEALKQRATELKRPIKKSELLRAGIAALHGMSDKAFLAMLDRVPSLKTGRPAKDSAS